jgi:hypothetical protein
MIRAQDQDIQSLVADIRDGKLLLPEMQRRYVWNDDLKPYVIRHGLRDCWKSLRSSFIASSACRPLLLDRLRFSRPSRVLLSESVQLNQSGSFQRA